MSAWLSVVLLFICVWSVWAVIKLPAPWRCPVKIHPGWYSRFPDATREELCHFLELVSESFVFDSAHKFKLHPDQSLLSIYQVLNPIGNVGESLEIESLMMLIEKEYDCEVSVNWDCNLTLAGLFAKVRYINPITLSQPSFPIGSSAN